MEKMEPKVKRKNLTWACDECKKAKVRCDGKCPCGRCTRRTTDCHYSPQKKRGFPQGSKKLSMRKIRPFDESTSKPRKIAPALIPPSFMIEPVKGELLDIYETYFHPSASLQLIPMKHVRCPTTEVDKFFQCIALLYALNAKKSHQEEVEAFEVKVFAVAENLKGNITLDAAKCLSVLGRYCFCKNAAACDHWSKSSATLLDQLPIQGKRHFLDIYKIKNLSLSSSIERESRENSSIDTLQKEFLAILDLSEEEVLRVYQTPKSMFQTLYNLCGDPPYRLYFHHAFRLDDRSGVITAPPWLAIDQYECISSHMKTALQLTSIGIEKSQPFIEQFYDMHKCAMEESINNNNESIRIASSVLDVIRHNIDKAPYSAYYIILTLQSLFKCFFRNKCLLKASEVISLQETMSPFFPRLTDLAADNKERLEKLNSGATLGSLCEEPLSLHQIVRTKSENTKTFTTKIPLILEPPFYCEPPKVWIKYHL